MIILAKPGVANFDDIIKLSIRLSRPTWPKNSIRVKRNHNLYIKV